MSEYQVILTHRAISDTPILNSDGTISYIVTVGDIIVTETLTILPGNIDKIGVQFVRNEFYYSILRSLSLTLDFAFRNGGGGKLILNAYSTDGIKANIEIIINKLNHSTNRYELFYPGVLNFTPGSWTINRDTFSISTMESSKMQRFISRDTIDFDILKNISADNTAMPNFVNSKTITLTPIDIILNASAAAYFGDDTFIPHGMTSATVPVKNPSWYNNGIGDRLTIGSDAKSDTTTTIYTNSTNFDANFTISFNGLIGVGGYIDNRGSDFGASLMIATLVNYYDKDGNLLYPGGGLPIPYSYITGQMVINATPGDKIYFNSDTYNVNVNLSVYNIVPAGGYVEFEEAYFLININDINASIQLAGSLVFNFQEFFVSPAETTVKAIFPHEAFTRLIQLATSELDTDKLFESNFFGRTDSEFLTYHDNGEGALDAITTGYLIRNFPNPTFPLNIRDLFKSFDAVYNLGLGYDRVNDRFYIEPKNQFFQSNYFMFDLGDVVELKITAMSQAYYSKLTSGFENKGDYWDLQGAYEFNVQREDSISAPVKEDKNIRSKYNWDSVGIELARRKPYTSDNSLDTKQDNNIYIVRTDGNKPVLDSTIIGFPGIKKYYNTMLSPRKNIIRWANILRACLFKNNDPIKYQTSSKVCDMSYDGVSEFSDIPISVLNESVLFKPELYSLKSFINAEIIQILNQNPHGYITFTFNKLHYAMFLNNVQSGDYNKEATYEGIAMELQTNIPFEFENGNAFEFENGEPFTLEGR